MLNSAGTGNPSSGAQGLELNSGEQLKCFVLIMPALLRAQLRFKITATARVLLLLAGAELIQVSLSKFRAKPYGDLLCFLNRSYSDSLRGEFQ